MYTRGVPVRAEIKAARLLYMDSIRIMVTDPRLTLVAAIDIWYWSG